MINTIGSVILVCFTLSCDKDENNLTTDIDTRLILNEWQTISQRIVMQNGENHLLLCETENFKNDGKYIMSYTGMSGNTIRDTSVFEVQPDKKTIKFYGYSNGILNPSELQIAKIKTLKENLFVYHCIRDDGSIMIIDSLKR